jgi:hypothetical protein
MYGFAVEFIGPDTAKGREMISLWQYEGFRHIFRIITAVWGVGFLLEAARRVAIVYNTSTGRAYGRAQVSFSTARSRSLLAVPVSAWTHNWSMTAT